MCVLDKTYEAVDLDRLRNGRHAEFLFKNRVAVRWLAVALALLMLLLQYLRKHDPSDFATTIPPLFLGVAAFFVSGQRPRKYDSPEAVSFRSDGIVVDFGADDHERTDLVRWQSIKSAALTNNGVRIKMRVEGRRSSCGLPTTSWLIPASPEEATQVLEFIRNKRR